MRQLPDYCAQDSLLVPTVAPEAERWLVVRAPGDLESIQYVGVPKEWIRGFVPMLKIDRSGRYDDRGMVNRSGLVGSAAVFAQEAIGLADPSLREWVIAENGDVVLCHSYDPPSAFRYNSSYTHFLLFVTALRGFDERGEWPGLEAVTAFLRDIDSTAFIRPDDPWPEQLEEMDRVRARTTG